MPNDEGLRTNWIIRNDGIIMNYRSEDERADMSEASKLKVRNNKRYAEEKYVERRKRSWMQSVEEMGS